MKLGVKRVSKLVITVSLMLALTMVMSVGCFSFAAGTISTSGNNPYVYGDWGSIKGLYSYYAPGYSNEQLSEDILKSGKSVEEIMTQGKYGSLNAYSSYEVVTYTGTTAPNPNQFVGNSSDGTIVTFTENAGSSNSLCSMLTFSKPYTVFENNTFSSCTNLETVVFLNDGSYTYDIIKTLMLEYYGSTKLTISDGSFSNCSKLSSLVFCTDDISISSTAFSGSSKNITVYGPVSGGKLEAWAKSRGFAYVAYSDLAETPAAGTAPENSTNNDPSYDEISYIYTGEGKPTNTNTSSSPFTDVSSNDWYYESVVQAHKLGVIDGYGNGQFGPKDSITRAQICQILYNYYGNGATYTTSFTDVPANEWYVNAIGWAETTGAVKGYGNGAFGPNDNVTYEQIAQILYNLEGNPDVDTSILSGKSYTVSDWAKAPYAWAVKNNLVSENSIGSSTGTAAIRGWVADAVVKYLAAFEGVTLPSVE